MHSLGFYVFPRAKPEGIHKTARRVQITADLYRSAPLIVNYVFTVLKRSPQLPWSSDIPWLQRGHYKTWTVDSGLDRGLDSGLSNRLDKWTRISIARVKRSLAY